MHNNFDDFVAANTQCCSNSKAASENGKRFEIVSKENFTKVKIDQGVIPSETEGKCDYGFIRHSNDEFYFVELKGKDVETAFDQIVNTIRLINTKHIVVPKDKRLGFIVSSKIPKSGVDIGNLKQKFAKTYGRILKIQNRELKYVPE